MTDVSLTSHTPSPATVGANVVELDLLPALLADPFEVAFHYLPEYRLKHLKAQMGTVLIPLQSAEGQKQRQGRHQG